MAQVSLFAAEYHRPDGAPQRARKGSLAWHLAILCLAVLLPILGLCVVLAWTYAGSERARLEQETLRYARSVATAVDL